MRPVRQFFALAALAVAGCAAATGAVQTRDAAEPDMRTIWEGVYTVEQARRGESVAWVSCLSCHTANEWSDPRFMEGEWGGQRVGDLFTVIQRSMPEDDPGRLESREYADIVAYMLRLSGVPAGGEELPADIRVLDRILIQIAETP